MKKGRAWLRVLALLCLLGSGFFGWEFYQATRPVPECPTNPERGDHLNLGTPGQPLKIGFFSDNHGNLNSLQEILETASQRGEAALCSLGDIVSWPQDRELDYWTRNLVRLRAEEKNPVPIFFAPGNHETAASQQMSLFGKRFGRTPTYFRIQDTLIFLLNNSSGHLDDEQCAWLSQSLESEFAKADRPQHVLLAMHIPPTRPMEENGSEEIWSRNHVMRGGTELLRGILRKGYPIRAIVCGHIGASLDGELEGVPVFIRGGAGAGMDDPDLQTLFFFEITMNGEKVSFETIPLAASRNYFNLEGWLETRGFYILLPLAGLLLLVAFWAGAGSSGRGSS